ncbi:transferrin-binding protein-like solute binding protein [Thiovibrio frasassiensis]|uniref:FecR domain-containing protein n=1 Tax=Thiovibrio frasassiensis TaxID=2984131 RepID=A0A9X4MID3_9BACT|nr:FecR domain-containing protein [Thiovibrio frasassiensis]MDG4476913.1 FecR domain-containing protein [Thiovibrio frasassiensis]
MKINTSLPIIIAFLILSCLTGAVSSAYAESLAVATVVALRGTVVAQNKSGTERPLSMKSQIFQEDLLKTDKNGQLQILFSDKSIITLGRESEMKIAEYHWQPGQKESVLKTQVKEGTFRVMGGAMAKDAPQNFKTETPTATIGIRGSMYAFRSTVQQLSVVFQGGRGIDIFNDLGRVAITTPGFGTHVMLNTPPAPPSRFTEQELKRLNQQLNGNGDSSGNGGGGNLNSFTAPLTVPPPPQLPPTNELPGAPATPFALSTNAVINTSFVGTYTGGIDANYTDNNVVTPLTGTFNLTANFASQSITGDINLNHIDHTAFDNYGISGVSITSTPTSNSFTGSVVSSSESIIGSFTGAFYGPAAEVVKGGFSGSENGVTVNGTFGGNRTTTLIQ